MNSIKFFDNFDGEWKDAIGTGGDIISFVDGSGWTSVPKKGFFDGSDLQGFISASQIGTGLVNNTEFNYLDGVTGPIQANINSRILSTSWIDYSATSTIVGWSAFTTKKIQYKLLDSNMMFVQFEIEGTGTGGSASFTIPVSASAWGTQYGQFFALDNISQNTGVMQLFASTSVCNLYRAGTIPQNWSTGTPRRARGTFIINI